MNQVETVPRYISTGTGLGTATSLRHPVKTMDAMGVDTKGGSGAAWLRGHRRLMLPTLSLLLVAAVAVLTYLHNEPLQTNVQHSFDVLTSGDHQRIRDYLHGFGAWGPVVSLLLMVAQVLVAPIPASVVQLANGVVYGQLWGTLLNIAGQMAGALLAFGIARSLGKGTVEQLIGRIHSPAVDGWLEGWGGKALFVIRAVPSTPSDMVSYLAGLTNMPRRTYVLATFLGYIPQSFLFAWLGDAAMGWFWWMVLAGLGVSGVMGLAGWILQRRNHGVRLHPQPTCS